MSFHEIPPEEVRADIIASADDEQLEEMRQQALSRMDTISRSDIYVDDEHVDLGLFVGDVESEQQRRDTVRQESLKVTP